MLQEIADAAGEHAGIPYPIEGLAIQTEDRYRDRDRAERIFDMREARGSGLEPGERLRAQWFSRRKGGWVFLVERDGRVSMEFFPRASYIERFNYLLTTIQASQAWDLERELRAQEKLRSLVQPHLFAMYVTTGCLLETSSRSGVTYILRRTRPTIAMAPMHRWDPDTRMKVIAVLCMHPLALYRDTWAGCMVPTDDVIAHLLYIRGDEAGFWRRANQHDPNSPEAGI